MVLVLLPKLRDRCVTAAAEPTAAGEMRIVEASLLAALELALAGVEQVREVLRAGDELRDEALGHSEQRHQHPGADLVLARHQGERTDAGDVEELTLEVAALDDELGLVLGPLERDLGRRLRRLGRPDDGRR